jgi:hypothetical protein
MAKKQRDVPGRQYNFVAKKQKQTMMTRIFSSRKAIFPNCFLHADLRDRKTSPLRTRTPRTAIRRMTMKLYVGNLVYNMTESELHDLFSACGPVVSVRIITDHFTRQSKNFGYVEMSTPGDSLRAVEQLNGKQINNRSLVVRQARSRSERRGCGW